MQRRALSCENHDVIRLLLAVLLADPRLCTTVFSRPIVQIRSGLERLNWLLSSPKWLLSLLNWFMRLNLSSKIGKSCSSFKHPLVRKIDAVVLLQ